ncbi:MAG: hypothetical protein EP343_15215 [Deltaproteobacteria bacterium]|nr:MAG: hypothetical protein EP343_15215 [Deltaproteobacteria bacterium]
MKRVLWCFLVVGLGWMGSGAYPSAHGEVLFQWAAQGGVRFQYRKSSLNQFTSPPDFNEDRVGASFLLGLLGILRINDHVEFNFDLDMGELYLGHLKRGTTEGFAVLLNEFRLNLTESEQQSFQEQVELCKEQARKQGLPEAECNNPSFILNESLFLRELYMTLSTSAQQWLKLDLGLMNRVIGRAFVLDGFVLGMHLDVNWFKRVKEKRLPYRLEFDFFLPNATFTAEGKMSPVLHLKGSYVFRQEQQVSFFATYMYDGNNLAGKNLLPLWKDFLPRSLNDFILSKTGEQTSFSCNTTPSSDDLRTLRNAYPEETQQTAEDNVLAYLDNVCNKLPSSTGHHVWLGLEGKWKWRNKLTIEGSAIVYLSSMTIGLPQGVSDFRSFENNTGSTGTSGLRPQQEDTSTDILENNTFMGISFLGELQLTYHWTPPLSTSLFFLFAMGDTLQERKTVLHAFMGIAPQVRYTDVFFNGGINSYSSRRGIGVSGISGQGYIAPGLKVHYYKEDYAEAKLTATAFWSVQDSVFPAKNGETPGNFYGFELNLTGSFNITKWLKPVAQIDLFVPGNFFTPSLSPVIMFQALVGLDFVWL